MGISVPAVEKSSPKQTLLISPDVVKGQFRAFRALNINHQHHNAAANTGQESFSSCSCVFFMPVHSAVNWTPIGSLEVFRITKRTDLGKMKTQDEERKIYKYFRSVGGRHLPPWTFQGSVGHQGLGQEEPLEFWFRTKPEDYHSPLPLKATS